MVSKLHLIAAGFGLALVSATPSVAQVQLNLCGVPPLPPCQSQEPRERVIIERERPARGAVDRFSDLCRTRTLRCRVDDPRPVGSRCICEDEEGEEIVGRIR